MQMKEQPNEMELSVVIPCLNEEKTIGICVQKAKAAIADLEVDGEVLVVNNGSTDRSVTMARAAGARVVHETKKGYGNAYHRGFREARGRFIIMGDADNTYDFRKIGLFLQPLRNGYDLVMGSRFQGNIMPGAMPWLHRYIGNPVLSGLLNLFFHAHISDSHCGMRGLSKEAYQRMELHTGGMEFASEMVIKALKQKLRITEVPVRYYPRVGESKLSSFRDGWRHLRFMLLYSPDWLFLWPGLIFFVAGLALLIALAPGPVQIGTMSIGVHFMILGSLLTLLGFQIINLAFYAKTYAVTTHMEDNDPLVNFYQRYLSLEKGILVGLTIFLIGLVGNLHLLWLYLSNGIGLPQPKLSEAILAMTLMVVGTQTTFSAFFLSLLTLPHHD